MFACIDVFQLNSIPGPGILITDCGAGHCQQIWHLTRGSCVPRMRNRWYSQTMHQWRRQSKIFPAHACGELPAALTPLILLPKSIGQQDRQTGGRPGTCQLHGFVAGRGWQPRAGNREPLSRSRQPDRSCGCAHRFHLSTQRHRHEPSRPVDGILGQKAQCSELNDLSSRRP